MSDIKLVSEEYTSRFVTGPELNTKLNEKQDTLQCYNESNNEVDIASNKVTLQSRVDTVGIKLDLNSTIDITVGSERNWRNILSTDIMDNVFLGDQTTGIYCDGTLYDKNGNEIHGGGSGSSFNYISEDYGWHTSLLLGQGPDGRVANSVFISGPLYGNEDSIFVAGPIVLNEAYDKDGKKITGGGSGGGSKWISDDTQGGKTILNLGHGSAGTVDSIFVCGPLYVTDLDNYINVNAPVKMCNTEGSWYGTTTIGMQETTISGGLGGFGIKYEGDNGTKTGIWIGSDTLWYNAAIQIDMYTYDGTRSAELFLDADRHNKLKSLIDNADVLLALLKK